MIRTFLLSMLMIFLCQLGLASKGSVTFPFKNFSKIDSQGDINIFVSYGKHYSVSAPRKDALLFQLTQKKDTLSVALIPETKVRPDLFITLPHVEKISYKGDGDLVANKIHSHHLNLLVNNDGETWISGKKLPLHYLKDSGHGPITVSHMLTNDLIIHMGGKGVVNLRGIANLRRLVYDGEGALNMYWLSSCDVDIIGSGHASAFIAGVADHANIVLSGKAYLNSRYLRAKKEYIKTHGYSRADVTAQRVLNALATGHSNVYYYMRPEVALGRYMKDHGAILSMHNLKRTCTAPMPFYHLAHCPLPRVGGLARA